MAKRGNCRTEDNKKYTKNMSKAPKICSNAMAFFAVGLLIVKIAIGGANFRDCEIDTRIPYYLVVPLNGFCWIAFFSFVCRSSAMKGSVAILSFTVITAVLTIAWLILGTVVVFPLWHIIGKTGCNDEEICCSKLIFRLAFGITIFDWIVLPLGIPAVVYLLWDKHH